MNYPDGTEAQVGDSVLLDHGANLGVIHAVIDTVEHRRTWGVDEPGLMIESPYYGLVFMPLDHLVDDEIGFVSRQLI